MGIDLLSSEEADEKDHEIVSTGVERASSLLREVQAYFAPPERNPAQESIPNIIKDMTQRLQKGWQRSADQLQICCGGELADLSQDYVHCRKTAQRVLSSAYAILARDC